jgi:hypothetical protein
MLAALRLVFPPAARPQTDGQRIAPPASASKPEDGQ